MNLLWRLIVISGLEGLFQYEIPRLQSELEQAIESSVIKLNGIVPSIVNYLMKTDNCYIFGSKD